MLYPTSPEAVAAILKQAAAAHKTVRVVGSGHSFTPLVATDQWLISLERMQGVRSVDPVHRRASVWAGTTLRRLGAELAAHKLAQANLGDIDAQTLAGAISTGTHGTGRELGILATQVHSLTLVTTAGEILHCSRDENRTLFLAALVSLGALGIIVELTLNLQPAYHLHTQAQTMRWDACLGTLEQLIAANRHFEFFWFPYTNLVHTKTQNCTDKPAAAHSADLKTTLVDNLLFLGVSEVCRHVPAAVPSLNAISAIGMSRVDHVRPSHLAFVTPRMVKFQEQEYSIPIAAVVPALEQVRGTLEQQRFAVNFPVEVRFVQGDDIWLSPAHGRDSAYLAFHVYKGMEYKPYFAHVERIMRAFGGRPHWGKLHTLRSAELAPLYPHWADFQTLRRQLDPGGTLLSPYLSELLNGH